VFPPLPGRNECLTLNKDAPPPFSLKFGFRFFLPIKRFNPPCDPPLKKGEENHHNRVIRARTRNRIRNCNQIYIRSRLQRLMKKRISNNERRYACGMSIYKLMEQSDSTLRNSTFDFEIRYSLLPLGAAGNFAGCWTLIFKSDMRRRHDRSLGKIP